MIQAGVKRLVYNDQYRNQDGVKFLQENNIEIYRAGSKIS
jgi:deoxycytidylate deaminase